MNIVVDMAEPGANKALAIESACPCCGARASTHLYDVPQIPSQSCVLLSTEAEAKAYPCRDLKLAFCNACGFIYNYIFDEDAVRYSPSSEESQHFSGTFSSFAAKLAQEIADTCGIDDKRLVLEIGCGKGEFLDKLCSISGAAGVGIDPGYRADEGREKIANVRFINDYYSQEHRHIRADLVLCRHTLEHIADVSEFVGLIRDVIGPDETTSVVFETPDTHRILSSAAFWDIYYEHCSYFSLGSHARLFRRQRFDVTRLSLAYGGQYIIQYARPAAAPTSAHFSEEDDLGEMRALAATFPARVRQLQEVWKGRIRAAAASGKRIVLWGGGSKAVSFLTTLGLADEVAAVVDVNPYKQGKFLPATGHSVVGPSELKKIAPDIVVVMNPVYVREIAAQLTQMGIDPEILAL